MKSMFIILALTVATFSQNPEYCDPALCNGTPNIHIGCPGVAIDECPEDVNIFDMSFYKDGILNQLNKLRNELAAGRISHLPQAARMPEVAWNDELSYLATINARQCRFKGDASCARENQTFTSLVRVLQLTIAQPT